ncbi:DUF3326 domain-containing protein [bacterium]|nr:DUF3326 domain-containing protein [bacterium]
MNKLNYKKIPIMIVPTGVGAKIGGFAGDASQVARKIANEFGLIVNPNVVNAACFSGINQNMLYVEGWGISQFIKGNLNLQPSFNNKIGVIFDKAIPKNILNIHINTINAMKCVYGIDVAEFVVTDEEVGVDYFLTDEKISTGGVKNPDTLIHSAEKLINKGINVLAVVCYFGDIEEDDDSYEQGVGVDIVGGIEGIISHYVSSKTFVPTVHAPAFNMSNIIETNLVNEKVASEYITPTFLPCLFFGLNNAPLYVKNDGISWKNISALIMPYNSLGSSVVFDCLEKNIPVIAVQENQTCLDITSDNLGINDIINVATYDECIEVLRKL